MESSFSSRGRENEEWVPSVNPCQPKESFNIFFNTLSLFLHISSIPSIVFFSFRTFVIHNILHIFQLRCVVFVKSFAQAMLVIRHFIPRLERVHHRQPDVYQPLENRPPDVKCLWLKICPFRTVFKQSLILSFFLDKQYVQWQPQE